MQRNRLNLNGSRFAVCGAIIVLGALSLTATSSYAVALTPVPVSGPIAGVGDGLSALWVGTTEANDPNSTADAEALLALPPGHSDVEFWLEEMRPNIDLSDGTAGGAGPDNTPAGVGDAFAVVLQGYLNVKESGPYTFSAYHDDGFRFNLGGATVMEFASDTAPTTTSTTFPLAPGLYELEYLAWEQGGAFVQELSWSTPSSSALEVIPSEVLFKKVPPTGVPDNGSTLAFLGLAFVGLVMLRNPSFNSAR